MRLARGGGRGADAPTFLFGKSLAGGGPVRNRVSPAEANSNVGITELERKASAACRCSAPCGLRRRSRSPPTRGCRETARLSAAAWCSCRRRLPPHPELGIVVLRRAGYGGEIVVVVLVGVHETAAALLADLDDRPHDLPDPDLRVIVLRRTGHHRKVIRGVLVRVRRVTWRDLSSLLARPIRCHFGALRARRSLLSLPNLAVAVQSVLNAPGRLDCPLIVADPTPVTVPEMITAMRAGLGRRPGLVSVSPVLLEKIFRLTGRSDFMTASPVLSSAMLHALIPLRLGPACLYLRHVGRCGAALHRRCPRKSRSR